MIVVFRKFVSLGYKEIKIYKNDIVKYILVIILMFVSCTNTTTKKTKQIRITGQNKNETTLPFYKDPSFTPHWIDPTSTELGQFHKIPEFTLINQEGDTITQKTFDNKIYVTDFFFTTCPGICPKMTESMSDLADYFKEDNEILLLSHSVTPKIDSVSVLKEYANYRDIDPEKWHLVTGDRDLIYDLGRNYYFVEESLGIEKDINDFLHTENFLLIDKRKHIRGIYNGLFKSSIKQLINDIQVLKQEG